VYSLVQNVTVKVYSRDPNYLQIPQASPPTFLFLLIFNCQKTDRSKQSQNQIPKAKTPGNQQASAHQLDFLRTKDFVASSAAALVQ